MSETEKNRIVTEEMAAEGLDKNIFAPKKAAAPGVVGRVQYRVWYEYARAKRYSLGMYKTASGAERRLVEWVAGPHSGAWSAGIERITTEDVRLLRKGADE